MFSGTSIFKKTFLIIALLVLFLPIIQSNFKIVKLYELAGDTDKQKDTTLTFINYFSGNYQSKLNEHLSSEFGFRSLLIKLNNQINFSLFNNVNAQGVISGKDNYLFETTYINAQLGKDFIGEDSIKDRLKRLKIISDKLLTMNKHLMLIIAPGKPSFYREYLPDEYLQNSKTNNYSIIKESLKTSGLNYIDFSAYFNQLKQTSKYPLYPKHGNHWSTYGAYLAADSIIKFIEWKQHADLPDLSIRSIKTEQPKNDDKDIEYGINLLFRLKSFDLAYPEIAIDTTGKTKPNVLIIGDSFYWNLYHSGIDKCFTESEFRYYNQTAYTAEGTKQIQEMNFENEIQKYDVIIILATESNIHNLGWGFMEQVEKCLNDPIIN